MEAIREENLAKNLEWPLRPIATSINGDNSWLLSFPRPEAERGPRFFYHVVFEPWLNSQYPFLNSWFVHLKLSTPPACNDGEDVAAVAEQIEAVTQAAAKERGIVINTNSQIVDEDAYQGPLDAIFLGFHYGDHTHEATLRLFDKRIPVIASPEAAAIIKPWDYFQSICLISNFEATTSTWRDESLHPTGFPNWLTAVRLQGHHELNFVTVIIWTHEDESGKAIHEALMQSPHGYPRNQEPLHAFLKSEPPTRKLAMLHGLKESRAGGWQNTFGAKAGLDLYRKIGGCKYWILSHQSKMHYSGIVMRVLFVYDTQRTLEWALENEEGEAVGGKPNLLQVGNGDCMVLT